MVITLKRQQGQSDAATASEQGEFSGVTAVLRSSYLLQAILGILQTHFALVPLPDRLSP
jgi:hypothetical protein